MTTKELNQLGWRLIQNWNDNSTKNLVARLKKMKPLEAAYLASYITDYLSEDDESLVLSLTPYLSLPARAKGRQAKR